MSFVLFKGIFMRHFVFLLLITSFYNQADEYHYKNLLVGTKAIGLGGAFTAISDDLSAVFYNPAGLTFASTANSASISTFALEKTKFKDVFSTGEDLSRSSFSIVPSFLGAGGKYKDYSWSFAFAVPDLSSERTFSAIDYTIPNEFGGSTKVTEFAHIYMDNTTYKLGLAGAAKLTENLSLGLSFVAKYNEVITSQGSGVSYDINIDNSILTSGFQASRRNQDNNLILSPAIGLLLNHDIVDLGMSVKKDIAVSRELTATHTIVVNSATPLPPGVTTSAVGTIVDNNVQRYPTLVSIGFAKTFNKFQLSFDVDSYLPIDIIEHNINSFHPPTTREYKSIKNYSLGLSYQDKLGSTYRLGVFTDNANISIDTEKPYQRAEAIDLIGVSFSINTELFEYPISFGGYFKYGSGKVRVADIRVIENIVGLPLYPNTNNFDISEGEKRSFVTYISANF